ncbi:MAG: class I SAM-dependent methyltransferase [Nanoarchaeota archaeon]
MRCYICSNDDLIQFLDLGKHPPPLNFVSKENLKRAQSSYPLQVCFCNNCGLVQLGDAVDPNVMFKDYLYTSGVSTAFRNHLSQFAKSLVDRFSPIPKDLVIDIASNDGTLLKFFQSYGVRVLGIEPSNIAKLAEENGISTINDFFNEDIANKILEKHGQAKIITITNAFAHIKDLDSIMKGIKLLLMKDGVFVSESQYLVDIIEKLEYDTIYHEHLRYYSLHTLLQLFEKYNMEIFDCERISSHGGSIRVYAASKGQFIKSNNIEKMLNLERKLNLSSIETYKEFANRVYENKNDLLSLLQKIKSSGQKIVGISAPARSSTILNFCHIDSSILDYVVEKSPLKLGKFTPGTHIEVVDDSKLVEDQPDYALLLSWHLSDSIIPKIQNDGYKGKIIVPLPKPKII